MVNRIFIVGNLGKDPESKTIASGTVTKLAVATSEKWTKDGEAQEKTTWHSIVIFGKTAENCGKYLKKGSQVYIEGKLQARSYEKDGVTKYVTEIVANDVRFLGGSDKSANKDHGGATAKPLSASTTVKNHAPQTQEQAKSWTPTYDGDDAIPF